QEGSYGRAEQNPSEGRYTLKLFARPLKHPADGGAVPVSSCKEKHPAQQRADVGQGCWPVGHRFRNLLRDGKQDRNPQSSHREPDCTGGESSGVVHTLSVGRQPYCIGNAAPLFAVAASKYTTVGFVWTWPF